MPPASTSGISPSFPELSPSSGQVVYVLLNRLPLTSPKAGPLDLHTLGTPLAFVLSQDQTLHVMWMPTASGSEFFSSEFRVGCAQRAPAEL